jgi:hypothetical protein
MKSFTDKVLVIKFLTFSVLFFKILWRKMLKEIQDTCRRCLAFYDDSAVRGPNYFTGISKYNRSRALKLADIFFSFHIKEMVDDLPFRYPIILIIKL